MDLTGDDRHQLADLSHRYASLADSGAYDEMGELFTEDAVLVPPAGPREGRQAIVRAMRGLDRYDAVFHLVGQVRTWTEGEAVLGETYCVAHHFTAANDGTKDRVMYIRYRDRFARDGGTWRFARRELEVVWAGQEDKPPPS